MGKFDLWFGRPRLKGKYLGRPNVRYQRCAKDPPAPLSFVMLRGVTGASGGNPGVVEMGIYHKQPPTDLGDGMGVPFSALNLSG